MGTQPEELSTTPADIEATRHDLTRDIDELSDKLSPGRVVERRKQRAREGIGAVRERVMGRAGDVGGSASSATSSVKDGAQSAVGTLGAQAQGHPLTAGLVAFGAGVLLSSLLPASREEAAAARRTVEKAKQAAQPIADEARSVGQDVGQRLADSAKESAQQVKAQAQDSAGTVKQEGQESAQQVADQARG